jgi:hypothetical protein
MVYSGSLFNSLKRVLDNIVDDKLDGIEGMMLMPKYFEVSTMEDAYVDDLEMSGPGLLREKPEGEDLSMGNIVEGAKSRYLARTYALGFAVTEEAREDEKYDEVIAAARRLKRACWLTVDYDAATMLIRGFNTAYAGGDGLPLWSASHTLPQGGTFSNLMTVPVAPSVQAVVIATTQVKKFPGHDGLLGGNYVPVCVVCPVDQWETWEVITGSSHRPDPGEFNAINVVNQKLKLDVYPNVFWSTTTTNWMLKTNVENGLKWKWRVRPASRTWSNNEQWIEKFAIRARWTRFWSDPRATLGVNA